MTSRWKHRPAGSTWGDFGPNDQLGRLNLLTPDKVRQAAAEVRVGLSFCLSLPLDYPGESKLNPRRKPPQLSPTMLKGEQFMNYPMNRIDPRNTDVVCDDQVTIALQYSTQWDSFAHMGALFDADGDGQAEIVYYNGYRGHEHIKGPEDPRDDACGGASCATALGIENFAVKPIQGRGVLVDLHAHVGNERRAVGYDELMGIMQQDKVEIESGDILVVRTGFSDLIVEMNRHPDMEVLNRSCAALDGCDEQLLTWITDSGMAAICADNYAVEAYPAKDRDGSRPALPLHQHCLFKIGVPLGELWWLRDLAQWLRAHRRSRFLLTAPPLRLPGAVGSPVTPVATV
jgi:kynurenine formamidase